MHDVLRDYVIRQVDVPLPALHGVLVDAYACVATAGWASGPNDGYFFSELAITWLARDETRSCFIC